MRHPSWSYTGEQAGGESPQQLQDLIGESQPLDHFFALQYRTRLTDTHDLICKDFCLVRVAVVSATIAHPLQVVVGRFLLMASATPATEAPQGETGPSAGLPLVACTTFHLLDMATGARVDQLVLHDDLVNLSAHHGVSVLDNMVAIVAVC